MVDKIFDALIYGLSVEFFQFVWALSVFLVDDEQASIQLNNF